MATYTELRLALDLLTDGGSELIPKALQTSAFRASAESLRNDARAWLEQPQVQGIGIGERTTAGTPQDALALKIYVDRKQPAGVLSSPAPSGVTLPELGTVPVDVEEIGRIEAESHTSRVRPAQGGMSVGHVASSTGTFGCLVSRIGEPEQWLILSNAHVLGENGSASIGDAIVQQGPADGGASPAHTIARLTRVIPIDFAASSYPNLVDAAIAAVGNTGDVVREIRHLNVVPGPPHNAVRRKMKIQKVGRTTDHTTGTILDVDARIRINYSSGSAGFRDQVVCTRYSAGGDSGSAVLSMKGRLVGLHFAGSSSRSFFNKIGNVFSILHITLA